MLQEGIRTKYEYTQLALISRRGPKRIDLNNITESLKNINRWTGIIWQVFGLKRLNRNLVISKYIWTSLVQGSPEPDNLNIKESQIFKYKY